jgi:hypothetical protein
LNPVIRDEVLDICLNKPELAEALYETAVMELSDDYTMGHWAYRDVPIRASHLGYLMDIEIISKVVDTNSRSLFTMEDAETVYETIETFLKFQKQDSFERDLYEINDMDIEVKMTRSDNFYHIEWEHGSLEVPPNQLRELVDGVKAAWRFEELLRRSQEDSNEEDKS